MSWPPAEDLPKTVLSFMYHIIHDESVRDAFKSDPDEVMEYFNLPPEFQAMIRLAGNDGQPVDEHILCCLAYVFPEIKANYYGTW
jgi:hypothetical protein